MAYTEIKPDSWTGKTTYYQEKVSSLGVKTVLDNFSTNKSVSLDKTRSGERVPDWRKRIAEGVSASSPYTLSASKLTAYPADLSFFGTKIEQMTPLKLSQLTERFEGFLYTPKAELSLSVQPSDANSIALSKTYSKVTAEYQQLNLSASLAEFGDVVRQFGAPAAAIVDLSNRHLNRLALERRGLKGSTAFKRIKWLEIVASSYLEYSFGLAPLIDDTRKAAEALKRYNDEANEEILRKFRRRIVSRGSSVGSKAKSTAYGLGRSMVGLSLIENRTETLEARTQYVVGLKGTPTADFGSNDRLLQLLGLTPKNIPLAIWEAIPWSWLLDYFTNVQQILSAGATVTTDINWIVRTDSSVRTTSVNYQFNQARLSEIVGPYPKYFYSGHASGTAGSYELVSTTMTRTIPGSLGVPPLMLEIPVQVGQLANMVAVLFSRRPSSSALWVF